jgi:hypothetical protein
MCDVGRRTASGRAAGFRSSNQPNLSFSFPAACLSGTAPDQLEQAVAGADHRPSASRISGRVPPTPGVDNAEKDGVLWKPFGIGGQQVGGRLRIADRRIGARVRRVRPRRRRAPRKIFPRPRSSRSDRLGDWPRKANDWRHQDVSLRSLTLAFAPRSGE